MNSVYKIHDTYIKLSAIQTITKIGNLNYVYLSSGQCITAPGSKDDGLIKAWTEYVKHTALPYSERKKSL